ncbi:MAG: MFS transporter [Dehalococcoidia bacterium]|nr:MFS transporter [Dehalococcoidia bacterium]
MKSKQIFGLNPNVFFLGLISFLTDVSSEMIFTLLPLFLFNVLQAPITIIGLIEGAAESIASLLKIFSGWLSDRLGKRKRLTILGYVLSTFAKPFMYIATTWSVAFGVRFADRVGKGMRTAPLDALVADSLTPEQRGKGFGLHRAMDTFGALVGIVSAVVVIFLWQGENWALARATYQQLVLIGVIPAVLALFIFFFVREPERQMPKGVSPTAKLGSLLSGFDKRFKIFLGIIFLFTLGNSSDAFLILRAQNLGNPVLYILLMLVLFNFVYASLSTPAGILSDKLGRKRIILLGWLIYALVYLGFALVPPSASWQLWLLFGLYGVYYGLAEGVARAFVADLVPAERRGTAYGLFHGVVGIALLPASLIAGCLWQAVNPAAPFLFGAGLAFLAMIVLLVLIKE